MSDREAIFGRVRAALAGLPVRAARPSWDASLVAPPVAGDLEERFVSRLEGVHGVACRSWEEVAQHLEKEGCRRGYVAPSLLGLLPAGFGERFQLETTWERSRVDDYAFGITRATAGIAETGTLVLTDADTSHRLAALAPWVHVAVLERSALRATVVDMLGSMPADPNVIWITGPSKTADVEGILIEGVHGPGVQIVLLV